MALVHGDCNKKETHAKRIQSILDSLFAGIA